MVAFWGERAEVVDDPNLRVTLAYRMGEICEGPLGDTAGARQHFESILDIAPSYLPALEGLERIYTRLEAWTELAAVYEQRAILSEEPAAIALQLHRAGSVCEFRMADGPRAREFYRRALDHVADFPPSLDAMLRVLEAEGAWDELASTLRTAAGASHDGSQQVSLYYRAGRVFADRTEDAASAVTCLEKCLELSPGFLSAHYLLKELRAAGGDLQGHYELQRSEADAEVELDRRAWQLLAAADMAQGLPDLDAAAVVQEVLDVEPGHPGAMALLEQAWRRSGNLAGLVGLFRNAAAAAESEQERARLAASLAEVLRDVGDSMGAVQAAGELISAEEAEDRPLLAIARLCEGLNYWEESHRALTAAGETYDAARLQEDYLEGPELAIEGYEAVLAADETMVGAAAGLARLQRKAGNREALAEAHFRLARLLEAPSIRVVHAVLAGHLFEGLERQDEALASYQLAFASRPSAGKAFGGARRILVARKDLDGLTELYAGLAEPDPAGLASALEEAESASAAADALSESGDLVSLVRREAALEAAGRWQEAFDVLRARTELLQDSDQQAAAEAKQRWMLAEKLAETEQAWDLYRQLHEERPDDTEVLEALARIAGARGEVELGVQYLSSLASKSNDPLDAARYQRRIGEIHERNGAGEEARDAYLAALDQHPEDTEALGGLRRVAEAAEDWQAMVGVLAREASLVEGADQVQRYAEIARIWQDRLGDDAVAADSWRKVLELAPDDAEALGRLVALSEASSDWTAFVEHGAALADHLEGDERSGLQRRIGLAWSELRNEDEALRWLDAASGGDHPDLEAAVRLENMRSIRGEWDQVVESLRRQARAQEGEPAVQALIRAARIHLDTLQDRVAAAAAFEQVLAVDPEHPEALTFVAEARFESGDREGAVELFERIELGADKWDLDDFDERVEVAQFYHHYGATLSALGDKDGAKEKLGRALELNPSHLPSLREVGPLYLAEQDWKRAEQVYRQVLQLIGGSGNKVELCEAYTSLGEVERALGKLDKARKRFNKALELRPNDVRSLQGTAGVLFDRGEWSNLLNVYNNVIYHAKEPADVITAYLTKGFVLDARMGLADKAAQHFQKTLAFDPGQSEALLRLAELALRKQDAAEAANLAQRAAELELEPSRRARVLLVLAAAAGAVGDADKADSDLAAAYEADPGLAEAVGQLESSDSAGIAAALKTDLQASR